MVVISVSTNHIIRSSVWVLEHEMDIFSNWCDVWSLNYFFNVCRDSIISAKGEFQISQI